MHVRSPVVVVFFRGSRWPETSVGELLDLLYELELSLLSRWRACGINKPCEVRLGHEQELGATHGNSRLDQKEDLAFGFRGTTPQPQPCEQRCHLLFVVILLIGKDPGGRRSTHQLSDCDNADCFGGCAKNQRARKMKGRER